MEEGDTTSLITDDDVTVLQEECLSRPSTCTTYETFETFMQSLAPSMELPSSDDDAPEFSVRDSSVSRAEETDPLSMSETISTPEEEVKRLKDLVALLQIRLDATSRVVEIQEKELCREMEGDEETRSNYEKLLNRWRREVCILLLKQRVDTLQVEQRRLQHTQKEQHLTVQLQEARALVEVLKQKERNLQAEIGILTTGQKLAEMTMRAEAARRQHEMEGTVKGVTRAAVEALSCFVDQHSAIMFHQLERLGDACCSGWLQVGPLWTAHKIQRAACDDGRKCSVIRRKICRYSLPSEKGRG
ncbi:hypothetical protein R1sor_026182 [Riccia sorocarpa]|uniref:Alpha-helical coiled-coil rod protein n=1 Tax=Riccia sorocarpa TaxID=122646 RepID=A0ABD3GGC3_9MARC